MRVALLSGILFLSGGAALIFETLWLRQSGLTLGNSVWSTALILSSFMTGLALGNSLAATKRLHRWRPLRVYALLEIAIAAAGCAIVIGLPTLGEWLRPLFQTLWNHDAALNGLRFALSFLILLAPTTAMGLTLPVLLEDGTLRRQEFQRVISLLYGANTLGAVAGIWASEAWLVQAVGIRGTALAATIASGAAAILALLLAQTDRVNVAGETAQSSSRHVEKKNLRPVWRLLAGAFGAGGILLALEVVWFRFLTLYVASTSAAFAVMLAVVLAGIGLGGLASAAIHRRFDRPGQLLPIFLMAAAFATLACYAWFPLPAPQGNPPRFYVESWTQIAGLALALMFPVSFLSGVIFPAVVARVQAAVQNRMNSAGVTTLFNTAGAALGPLLASFVLLPRLGFQTSLIASAIGYALLAVLVSERADWSFRRAGGLVLAGLGAAALGVGFIFLRGRDTEHLANARRPYETDGSRLIKTVEGTADTLQVLRRDLFGEPYYYRLVTNGYSMSGTHPRSQRYMRMFAYLPLTFQPAARDALLICYGVGVTADALVREPHLAHIDVVDISQEVVGLAGTYTGPGYSNPLADPRVTTVVQDGRFFLQASPRQYDVITGEPPPLKVAGAVNLYTAEFFSLMKARLKEGGIATFWLPIYQLRVDETKAILRAFHDAFPRASVWSGPDQEWIMMGLKGPGRLLSETEIRRLWDQESTRTDLVRMGLEVPEQLAASFLMDDAEIDRITQGVAPLTDRFPKRLSDALPDEAATQSFAWTYLEGAPAFQRFASSPMIAGMWPGAAKSSLEPFFTLREIRYQFGLKGGNWLAALDLYLHSSRLRTPVLEALNSDEFRVALAEQAAKQSAAPRADLSPDLIAGALARRDFATAIHLLDTERAAGAQSSNDFFLQTYLYCLTGKVRLAEAFVAANTRAIPHDWFTDWLWKMLASDFGFHPPR